MTNTNNAARIEATITVARADAAVARASAALIAAGDKARVAVASGDAYAFNLACDLCAELDRDLRDALDAAGTARHKAYNDAARALGLR